MLQGSIIDREDNQVTLLVGGVGHEVLCTLNALSLASASKTELSLWTHLVVREDLLQLYGFADKEERALFRELIRISGIGPKVALAILSGMDCKGLIRAIRQGDAQMLTRLPGIGKKTAERLVIEMQGRLDDWQPGELAAPLESGKEKTPDVAAEAEQALITLGYKPLEAAKMVAAVDASGLKVEDLIRSALQSRLKPS
jgi:Holliday junction DNA helicase RuvA